MSTDAIRRFYVEEARVGRDKRWQVVDRTGFMAPSEFGIGFSARDRAIEVATGRNQCESMGHVFEEGKDGCLRCDATPKPDVVYYKEEYF